MASSCCSCYVAIVHVAHSLASRHGPIVPRGRFGFVVSAWLALLTAIACATLPAGLPASRSIGSAFDPSTTAVALRGKQQPIVARVAVPHPDDGAGAGDLALRPRGGHASAPIMAADPTPAFTARDRPLAARDPDFTLFARPPPTH